MNRTRNKIASKGISSSNLDKIRTRDFFAWIDSNRCLEPPKIFVKLNSLGKTQGGHALFMLIRENMKLA